MIMNVLDGGNLCYMIWLPCTFMSITDFKYLMYCSYLRKVTHDRTYIKITLLKKVIGMIKKLNFYVFTILLLTT